MTDEVERSGTLLMVDVDVLCYYKVELVDDDVLVYVWFVLSVCLADFK